MLASREDCAEDCPAARFAADQARELLACQEATDIHWAVEFWLMPSLPGELRLSPAGGYPAGRVPRSFRAKWWRAVERAARKQAEELEALLVARARQERV
jgi:hypothetical protein